MFQFKNEGGIPYLIDDIDKMACEFWGVTYNSKTYASPKNYKYANWFDVLGSAVEHIAKRIDIYNEKTFYLSSICCDTNPNFDLKKVALQIIFDLCGSDNPDQIIKNVEYMKPFIDLCYHLQEKGIYATYIR